MPEPDLFGHRFAYERYTGYAADIEEVELVDRFPLDPDVRRITIELLADRYVVSDVVENPDLIDAAVDEARRSSKSSPREVTVSSLMERDSYDLRAGYPLRLHVVSWPVVRRRSACVMLDELNQHERADRVKSPMPRYRHRCRGRNGFEPTPAPVALLSRPRTRAPAPRIHRTKRPQGRRSPSAGHASHHALGGRQARLRRSPKA